MSVANKPTLRIGLFIESLSDRFWHELVFATADGARRRNAQLLVFVGGTLDGRQWAARHENRAYELALRWQLDGLLAAPLGFHAGVARLTEFYAQLAPLPLAALTVVMPEVPSICTDNCQAMAEAVEHLIRVHNARAIAFIRGPVLNTEAELRYRGYCEALRAHGITVDSNIVVQGDFTYESGQQAVETLRNRPGAHYQALVTANDSMALGALQQFEVLGVRVPEDVAVISFDDVPEGRWGRPSLSTVRQSLPDLADSAVNQLLLSIAGVKAAQLTQVAGCLMLRESCGCIDVRAGADSPSAPGDASRCLSWRLEQLLQDIEPGGSHCLPHNWRESLSQKLAWQVEEGSGQFLPALEDLLEVVAATGQALGDWQRVISRLCQGLTGHQQILQQGTLYAARVLVGEAAERQQARFRMQSEWLVQASLDAGSDVFGSFSESKMFDGLAQRLPAIGIGACVVVVARQSEQEDSESESRLVFAYLEGRRQPLPEEGLVISPDEPLSGHLGLEKVPVVTVASLYSGGRFIGTLYLELGPSVGQVYDWLRQQVGVALEGARMLRKVAADAAQRGQWERRLLAQELEVAAQVQNSVLPRQLNVPGLSIAATMVAASEVGGDCYDVVPVKGGCWLSIGDVAGHGLGPGVVVMSLQSSIAALISVQPDASPIDVLAAANTVLFDFVRRRLHRDEHATMTLIRYEETGHCVFAGAHEDLIIYRARTEQVVLLDTPGPWLGILPDIRDATELGEFWLEPGDILLLYTDGVLEAMNANREQYGMDRLVEQLKLAQAQPVETIVDQLLDGVRHWTGQPADDVTLVAVKQLAFRPSLPVD